jgi:hypothetical protein
MRNILKTLIKLLCFNQEIRYTAMWYGFLKFYSLKYEAIGEKMKLNFRFIIYGFTKIKPTSNKSIHIT